MISNMYSYFFVHTLHCMGFSVSSRKGGARDDDETVSTGCDAAVPYAKDSLCAFSGGPFVLSGGWGGGGGVGGRHTGTRLTMLFQKCFLLLELILT